MIGKLPSPSFGYSVDKADAREYLKRQDNKSVDLILGSPWYPFKEGRYGQKKVRRAKDWQKREMYEWIEFMVQVTEQAIRVCRGDVLWVVNNSVQDGRYWPAVEGLLWRFWLFDRALERPLVWTKNAPPNRKDWFGNNWEYIICFPGGKRTWNWEAIAAPPKYTAGGDFRQRDAAGLRRKGGKYPTGKLVRPRDVRTATVGGGHMGFDQQDDRLASMGEAPYPLKLVEPLVLALTNPGDTVLDCFCGSGTTGVAATKNGRYFQGCDLNEKAVVLSRRRIARAAAVFGVKAAK